MVATALRRFAGPIERGMLDRLYFGIAIVWLATHHTISPLTRGGLAIAAGLGLAGVARVPVRGIFLTLLAFHLVSNWFAVGNHTYVLLWVGLLFALCDGRGSELSMGARALLGVVTGFATLQKIVHPYYTDGAVIASLALEGELPSALLLFVEGLDGAGATSRSAAASLLAAAQPGSVLPLALPSEPFLATCVAIAWGGILLEGAVAGVVLLPPARFATLQAGLVGLAAAGIFVVRGFDEAIFLALMALLGLAALEPALPRGVGHGLALAVMALSIGLLSRELLG